MLDDLTKSAYKDEKSIVYCSSAFTARRIMAYIRANPITTSKKEKDPIAVPRMALVTAEVVTGILHLTATFFVQQRLHSIAVPETQYNSFHKTLKHLIMAPAKRFKCYVCGKDITRLSRHLITVHNVDPTIARGHRYDVIEAKRKKKKCPLCGRMVLLRHLNEVEKIVCNSDEYYL
ncbi:hypothetical protein RRG08_043890 [Elysia crispata]|uniref:C2H2-type domain-containing protein n=1 Tax=Elysia crispata TaxID=231223 RepID=A0AAE1E6S3_9GAST|nr:hypothetical protein RRG08_043890 [Elysia crispata]